MKSADVIDSHRPECITSGATAPAISKAKKKADEAAAKAAEAPKAEAPAADAAEAPAEEA